MDQILIYNSHEFSERKMKLCATVNKELKNSNISEDISKMVKFIKKDDFFFLDMNDEIINNDHKYSVCIKCCEDVGKLPYHLCWKNGKVYALCGSIRGGKMMSVCSFTPSIGNNRNYEINTDKEEVDVSGTLEYNKYCDEVDRLLKFYICDRVLSSIDIYKISTNMGDGFIISPSSKNNILIIDNTDSVLIKRNFDSECDLIYDMDYNDYIRMINLLHIALHKNGVNVKCDCIDSDLNMMKSSVAVSNSIMAAFIHKSETKGEIKIVYPEKGDYAFISSEITKVFSSLGVWFNPYIIVNTAFCYGKKDDRNTEISFRKIL